MLLRMLKELGHELPWPKPPPCIASPKGSAPADSGRAASSALLAPAAEGDPLPSLLLLKELSLPLEGECTSRTSFCRHSCERLASACAASRKSSGTPGPWLLMRRWRSQCLAADLGTGLAPLSPPPSAGGERSECWAGDELRDGSHDALGDDEGDDVDPQEKRDVLGELYPCTLARWVPRCLLAPSAGSAGSRAWRHEGVRWEAGGVVWGGGGSGVGAG